MVSCNIYQQSIDLRICVDIALLTYSGPIRIDEFRGTPYDVRKPPGEKLSFSEQDSLALVGAGIVSRKHDVLPCFTIYEYTSIILATFKAAARTIMYRNINDIS